MNKVLIITYYWPPSGGAGVQRWLRFSKYLPQLGWEPIILTIDPAFATYPVTDSSLEREVSDSLEVYRTKATDWFRLYSSRKSKIPSAGFAKNNKNSIKEKLSRFIRGNFFIPDPRRGWNKFAFRKACELIETSGIKYIISTSPPHSTQLIGLKLKQKYPGIKWIADLRDPWTDIYYYKQFYPTPIARKIDTAFEKMVLNTADRIITVGPSLKTSFSEKVKGISDKIDIITNGYDEDDFKTIPSEPAGRHVITYVGTLSDQYPLGGVLSVLSGDKLRKEDFLLRFVGVVPEKIKQEILSLIPEKSVEFIPYSPHNEAIRYMVNSTLLLLVIPDHVDNKMITTGKIFEYIASERPVLCLGPTDGDAAVILKTNGFGNCFEYNDTTNIEDFILNAFSNPHAGSANSGNYSHRNIAEKLVSFLK